MTVDKPGFSMYNSRIVCSDKMHKAKREGIVFHGFREEMESMTKLKRVLCGTLSALMLVSMPLISGCSTPEIAMTVDGREFTTGEYLAYLLHTFQQMDRSYYLSYYAAQGVDIWSQTFTYGEGDDAQKLKLSDYIKQVAQDTIIRQIVLKREMEANNLSPREEDREVMKEDTAGLTNDVLLAYGINKEHYMAMAEAVYTYERGLFFGLFDKGGPQEMSEEDILKYFNDYYLSYKIIELSLTEDGKDMDDEAKQEQLDKLEKYLKLYETEKDFDKVLAQYKEDINPTTTGTGTGSTTTTTTAPSATTTTNPTGTGTGTGTTGTGTGTGTGDEDEEEEENTDPNRHDIDANLYGDEDFTNAVKSVKIGEAKIVEYKNGGTTSTAALILRLDPAVQEGKTKDEILEDSREDILYGAKYEEYNKDILAKVEELRKETTVDKTAIRMCDPKNFMK